MYWRHININESNFNVWMKSHFYVFEWCLSKTKEIYGDFIMNTLRYSTTRYIANTFYMIVCSYSPINKKEIKSWILKYILYIHQTNMISFFKIIISILKIIILQVRYLKIHNSINNCFNFMHLYFYTEVL